MDRITSMRVFVETIAKGSLSAAGRALNMSPAMATKHVDSIESRLNIKLLHRTTRHLTLTDPGREYLSACRRILQDLDEVESELTAKQRQAVGTLRMNVPVSFGTRFIAPLLSRFSAMYPLVEIELGLSDSQQDLLEQGWDLIVRIGTLADSSLNARRLGDAPMVVCASKSYLEGHGIPSKTSDLTFHNCLSYSLSSLQGFGSWSFGRNGDVKVPVKGNLKADNGDALLSAALQGQGVIYQPWFIVSDALESGKLIALELDHPTVDIGGVHVLFSADKRMPVKVRVMIDFLIKEFTQPNS